ncbi:MAG: Glycosyl transferase family 39 [Candidatus Shapirobacteria bacterium GW2011_GWF1_38_23]|nr:MAG: Glycosyl transferase family 39 [Candidatus Shapirobacteria bacterium GW2011_GWF1_38_23]
MNKRLKNSLILILIIAVYFFLRCLNLTSLPVFGDEAIYIRWSQIIKSVDTLRFIPMTDGKQPLFMWLTAVSLKFFEPLVAGRIISVFAGAGTLVVLFLISKSFLPSLIYLFLPFAFFFDRLATADNLLSFFGVLSFYLSLRLAKQSRLDLSLILGAVLGLAWLTKSPAIYFVVLSLLTFIIYNPKNLKKLYLPLLSALIAFCIYNILRLGPQFAQIAIRNKDYIWPLGEILRHPFDPLIPHLNDVLNICVYYVSWPLLLSPFLYLFFLKKIKFDRQFILYLSWCLLPLIANAAMSKVFTARYILFTVPYLVLLLAHFLKPLFNKKYLIILLLLFIPNLWRIYQISFNPQNLKLPSTETGYVSAWTSGWGIKEVSEYLISRSKVVNVIVGTEGHFGTLPDGLQIYTNQVPQLTVFGVGINITEIPDKLKLSSMDVSTLTLVKNILKPDGDRLVLYRL